MYVRVNFVMLRRLGLLISCVCLVLLALPAGAAVSSADSEAAALTLFNRHIVTLQATQSGLSAAGRVERARRRFLALDDTDLLKPLSVSPLPSVPAGLLLSVGEKPLFALLAADLDPEDRVDLAQAMDRARLRVKDAIAARNAQSQSTTLLRGLAISAACVFVWLLAFLVATRLHGYFDRQVLQHMEPESADAVPQIHALTYLRLAGYRLAATGVWLMVVIATYLAALGALMAFPWTEPWGQELGSFVYTLGGWLVAGTLGAVPGLLTIAVIMFVARSIQDVLNLLFKHVQSGQLRIPFLHIETLGATRRLFSVLIWGLALAVAYPFLPGSGSDAFKGLSVMFGLMLTLGSTGVVTQWMSGLVVVYSRSLKRGDFVAVNGVEGVVSEVGTLAVKIVNLRNEEITLPNSVLTGNPIHNYSKLAGLEGTMISTRITIGYDTPWRQVHAMLILAAEKTPGIRREPKPFVYQRGLSDFYVEYEVFAHIDQPLRRIPILSAMLAAIQDEFNTHGVQIMSPNFVAQPPQAVFVPPDKWHEAPAAPPAR